MTQPLHRTLVGRVTAELKASQALERDDRSAGHYSRRTLYRVSREFDTSSVGPPETWTACRTCIRLRVKAPVCGVLILPSAGIAHLEAAHGRQRPVVRDVFDNREAGATVRAVGERIAIAAIGRIEDIGDAFGAGRRIGSDGLIVAIDRAARNDAKAPLPPRIERRRLNCVDTRQARRLGAQRTCERVEHRAAALNFDHHAPRRVADPAVEPEPGRQIPDEWAEPHPLDDAANLKAPPLRSRARWCVRIRRAGCRWLGYKAHRIMPARSMASCSSTAIHSS